MKPKRFHLAQANIARIRAPLDSPIMEGFRSQLDRINALADSSAGFVWRLQTDEGNATAIRAYEDERILFNTLVTSGPFRIVRNPFFSGWVVVALGIALLVPNAVAIAAVIVLIAAIELQVRVLEEPHLKRMHGEVFVSYASTTGRFVPSLARTSSSSSSRSHERTRGTRLDRGLGWGIVALGFGHLLLTPVFVPGVSPPALWFASGGGALMLVGVLNLLRADYSREVPALTAVSFLANAVTVVFLAVLAALEARTLWNPTYAAVLLVGAAMVLSLVPR
jgi:hypothetical protein